MALTTKLSKLYCIWSCQLNIFVEYFLSKITGLVPNPRKPRGCWAIRYQKHMYDIWENTQYDTHLSLQFLTRPTECYYVYNSELSWSCYNIICFDGQFSVQLTKETWNKKWRALNGRQQTVPGHQSRDNEVALRVTSRMNDDVISINELTTWTQSVTAMWWQITYSMLLQ